MPSSLSSFTDCCMALYAPEMDASSLMLKVQLACDRFQRWQERMKIALLENSSYQRLIDCSEQFLGNFISITDSSFRLIAYTKAILPQDDISQRLVKNGYHDMEAIDLFKRKKLFEQWRSESGLHVYEHPLTADTESASYIFRMQGTYFMHVIMRFNRHYAPHSYQED